ncbi:MAG: carbohydrate ABC transporter permease [Rhodoglobus sp.]|jgi:raffinose/stachyose/melibiose transport system permease protein|uniref:carbohydrate ABC transporter permease n=1 Tax=unclassified Microbacterium TaxID=2609290 RepID=UPI00076B4741|nr:MULTISPECIES: carbohydrate ABC transporter permease [unclassified Microbacterium]AMG83124.1 sugar ABC transporter permease [Microbacterium sp. PAMC 28756]MDZ4046685.1 carbohydrate ABC transporter permease [Rhodoglobus sp.]OSP08580.1 sugar ABC transporter permease [Microbacterium sp. LEMMJ01]
MNRYTRLSFVREVALIIVGVLFLVPLFALVNVAFKPSNSRTSALELDFPPSVANFGLAWGQGALGGALINSFIVAVCSVLGVVVIAAFASYPLARITRRWSRLTFYLFIGGLLIPTQLGLLPLYVTMRDLGLLGTLGALILMNIGTQLPFSIFLYTTFMREMPLDYEEAALLDGCGPVRTFASVVFPLLRAVTGTVVILNSVSVWNEFFTPLLYLSGSGNTTAPVAIYNFVGQYVAQWPLVFAGLIITVLPILVLYFILQKHIIKGFAGGLKG